MAKKQIQLTVISQFLTLLEVWTVGFVAPIAQNKTIKTKAKYVIRTTILHHHFFNSDITFQLPSKTKSPNKMIDTITVFASFLAKSL